VFVAVLVLALGLLPAARTSAAPPDPQDGLETFARDVFVIVGSSLRNPDDTTMDSATLFNFAGVNLGVTWGQWKAATATSTAHVTGNDTDVRISLHGLVPNGIYSVFYITLNPDTDNPLCPGVERGLALVSHDRKQAPDASSFTAGGDGSADYRGSIPGNPFNATQVIVEIIYHNDGQTWHPLPIHGEFNTQGANCRSSFGDDAMRQLLILQKFS
jgi:hypothetical protein